MIDIAPLLLLWAIGSGSKRSSVNVPAWPTAASPPPPPPMPSLPSAPAHPAESGTPLSELLKQADAAHAASPPSAARSAVDKAAAAARKITDVHTAASKAKSKGKRLLKGFLHAPAVGPPAPAQETVSVADLQAALIRRGYAVSRDGLYGPKTAAAWKSAANANHLSPMIARVGPKTARVANNTFDVLSVPAIP